MGSYKALYRKYRPQTFEEVVDQEYVTRTIRNAITLNRISHAYLFNGPRGIGKTSIARIFAKAINCPNTKESEPCCECEICRSIVDGSNPDIIEIDAASRTKVEQMRETLDKVSYLPSMCKYKVYIIDEVHMLSSSSFNALLKTLEEPPQHVIFILCTTEVEKVIPTIRSRCQRFDFHLVSMEAMTKRLRFISDQEGIKISDEALSTIAEVSEGGMRDSLSLLDQISSFSISETITADDVLEVSGGLSAKSIISIVDAINEGDSAKSINLLSDLIKSGKDVERINQGMITFFKDVLVEKNTGRQVNKVGYSGEDFKRIKDSIRNERLFKYIDVLTQAMNDYRFSTNKRLYFELALIKMCEVKGLEKRGSSHDFQESVPTNRGYDPNKTYSSFMPKEERREVEPLAMENTFQPQKEQPPVQEVRETVSIKPVEDAPLKKEEVAKEEIKPEEKTAKTDEIIEVKQNVQETKNEDAADSMGLFSKTESIDEGRIAPIQETKPKDEDEYEFDVKFVEDVLNEANKKFKLALIEMVENGKNASHGTDFYKYASLMDGGTIEASSEKAFVISFQSVGSCNLIMKKQNKEGVIEFIKNCTGASLDFLAITTSVFKVLSDQFIAEYKKNATEGKRERIYLSPVHCPGLRLDEQVKKEEDTQLTKLKSMFGDLLTVKE